MIATLERIALRRRLGFSRMPSLFAQLQRNTSYWPRRPFPASGDFVSFGRSDVLYRYFPGRGLQLHPLGTFKRANLIYGACTGNGQGSCSRTRLRRLLDEMSRFAARRGRRWIAWEYNFDFGGGSPPWMSGMAQATGIQALGHGANLLGRPRYVRVARRALGAFGSSAPVGVKARGFRGGVHYLQYSFGRRTCIYNAFIQALIGLHDFSEDTGDARARSFYDRAEPEARRRSPATSATGPCTPTAARSPTRATTSCCARSSRACATGAWAISTAPTPSATGATRRSPRDRDHGTGDHARRQSHPDPLHALEAVGGGAEDLPGGARGLQQDLRVPPRRRLVRLAAELAGHLHGQRRRQGAAHREGPQGGDSATIEVE